MPLVGTGTRVLCVDDCEEFGRALARVLRPRGWHVDLCLDAAAALPLVRSGGHDLLLLDWKMPAISGREACRLFRAFAPDLPIIVLTVEERLSEKLLAFDAGADDYVLKSTSVDELCARMSSVMRRCSSDGSRAHRIVSSLCDRLEVDLMCYRVLLDGVVLRTTPAQARFLILLVPASGRFVSLDEIVPFVYEEPPADPINSVGVLATKLRRKLARSGLQLVGRAASYGLLRTDSP